MSTLKVDSIENNGSTVNFTTDLAIGNGTAVREYYAQAGEPSGAGNGAVWWDTTNSVYKMLIEGEWYTVSATIPYTAIGSRSIIAGGSIVGGDIPTSIEYFSIPTPGNSSSFGDLVVATSSATSCSNGSRGLIAGGFSFVPSFNLKNDIQYITIGTLGNAIDFGDLVAAKNSMGSCSDGTYGLFGGGSTGSDTDAIDYVTIATTGNAADFGDLTVARDSLASCGSAVRGLFGGGNPGTSSNVIDYVTIATTGNATDFGDLTVARTRLGACSDGSRGIFSGTSTSNTIDYVGIFTTGNATDFGDLTVARNDVVATSDGTFGVFATGNVEGAVNVIDYITIATPGNATDFGDATTAKSSAAGCSGN